MAEYIADLYTDHDGVKCERVVRCRDCKYYEPNTYSHFTCELLTFHVEPDGFCKWGLGVDADDLREMGIEVNEC